MLKKLHPIAGITATVMISIFWLATVIVELIGSRPAIAAVKEAIPWGFFILIPALILTGFSGFRVAGKGATPEIGRKKLRMPFIAANGIVILVPAALYLASCAVHGSFGQSFYIVQAIELTAGAVNLTLMGLNIRDGLRLAGKL